MLKVECESCKAPYQVDERRVPPAGLKMRCPKCGHTFLVTDPSKAGAAGGDGGLPKPTKKSTMMGLAPKAMPPARGGAPGARQHVPPAAQPGSTPQLPSLDLDAALPAVKPKIVARSPQLKPTTPAMPAAAPPKNALPGFDDLDLPALPDGIDLPAAVKRGGMPSADPRPAAAKPAPAGPSPFTFEVDLPDLPASVPATTPVVSSAAAAAFGEIDLPAPKQAPDVGIDLPSPTAGRTGDLPALRRAPADDLPSTKVAARRTESLDLPLAKPAHGADLPVARSPSHADLPVRKGGESPAGPFGDLPVPKAGGAFGDLPVPKAGGAFGDLPIPKSGNAFPDLPDVHSGSGAGLPALRGGGGFGEIDLPSLQDFGPGSQPGGAHLPSPLGPDAHLPTASSASAHLPSPMGANAHLPAPMGAGAHLPAPMGANAHMPAPVEGDRFLPNRPGGPAPIAFGELDLPLAGNTPEPPPLQALQQRPPPQHVPNLDAGLGFGEVDLPGDGGPSLGPPPALGSMGSAGGMSFGEVDLGGSTGDSVAPMGPPPATSAGNFAFQEASLESAPAAVAGGRRAAAGGPPARSSRLPKLLGLGAALIVIGGTALQLTPVGAFGYLWITDKLHAGDNVTTATALGDAARKKLALDTFPAAQEAANEMIEARKRTPRSRPLGTYAAFVEYMNQVRFGIDPARAARVQTFITEVPPNTEVPFLHAAQAAQLAQTGDWEKAKRAADAASQKEPKGGVQQELAILKAEIALAQKDAAAAVTAWNAAHASGASARTSFGRARAHLLAHALPKAREAVDEALKTSPSHAGALTLRAQLAWELQRDDTAAMKDLDAVLDAKARKSLGPSELSTALAAKGWINLARDRAGDARTSFDEAVKIDPRNVSALVGQGEILYADGRYTEALTRFDEGVAKDPSSIAAAIGSAKTKIALERLQDAKTQLAATRQKAPKDMNAALWLARAEEALGNKKVADELYGAATELADPQNPDSVQAYAAHARFLASQGKTSEAAIKLDQARAKLPDSAALRRAFGEVAVAQGQFPEAVEQFEAALQKAPTDLGTRFRLGQTYRKMHRLDQAAKALDEVAAIDREYPGIALERGLLFEEAGDVQKALEQFQSASQKAPNDIDLMLRVGAAYVAIGDTEKGLPLLLKVKDQRPNSAEANHFVGRAYLKQGGLEIPAAMRYLQRAVALDPNKAEYHLYVAWGANESTPAQLGLARTHIDKALQLDKLLADAYWQRGVLERKEGLVTDAVKDLRRALELKPTRHEAHAALAEAYEDKNDTAAAIAEWQKAIAGDDKPPLWRWRYGRLLLNKNQSAEAGRHLVYAVEHGRAAQPRPGWLAPAAFEAGEALRKSGQKKEACEHYHLFMELAPTTSPDRRDAIRAQAELGCPYAGGK